MLIQAPMLTPVKTVAKSLRRPNLGDGCGSCTSAPESSVVQDRDLCFCNDAMPKAGDGGGAKVIVGLAVAAGDMRSLLPTCWNWKHLEPMVEWEIGRLSGLRICSLDLLRVLQ